LTQFVDDTSFQIQQAGHRQSIAAIDDAKTEVDALLK